MFHVQQRDGASLIEVQDDLDIFSSPALTSAIILAESVTAQRIIVSLENCSYCDSTALEVLARAKTRLGTQLLLVVPVNNRIRRVLDITGLTKALSICASIQDAVDMPLAS